jgi:hypothetical protein
VADHTTQTDKIAKVTLRSALEHVFWDRSSAPVGGTAGLRILTAHIGNNAEVTIEIKDKSGKNFGNFADRISGNRFWAQLKVPQNAKDELYATVKLPKHGLSMKSNPLIIIPPIEITNLKWSQKEARRGDILKLTADIKGAPEGTEAKIEIWEHDNDGSHDFITSFTSLVKNARIEAEWEYEYHEDTDEIPTEDEVKKYGNHYNPPEYFFVVSVGGSRVGEKQESGLLRFQDWIAIHLQNDDGSPAANEECTVHLPDGNQRKVRLDGEGYARLDGISAGPIRVELPGLQPGDHVESCGGG